MDTLSGFWAGAADLARRRDVGDGAAPERLHEVVARCGGWSAFARTDTPRRVAAGLSPAAAWLLEASRPVTTLGRALTAACPEYPRRLNDWPAAPPVLFVEGDPEVLNRPAVAIVGTRSCSPYGASVAHELGVACARAGLVVVSGLARGIDAAAHQGALAGGGATLAVLGHGLLHTAPPSHRWLRRRIVEAGGAMVSTWVDPVPPSKRTFPERNQWIAALSLRVVLVEAPERSGALHTANALLEVDRADQLRVVPGPMGATNWAGSTALLELGIPALTSVQALLDELAPGNGRRLHHPDWLTAVFAGADLGDAAHLAGTSVVELLRELTRLELAGRVVRLPGGRYGAAGATP